MAIDYKIYSERVDIGIKSDKEGLRFLLSVKRDGKIKRRVLDLSRKSWNKRDRLRYVRKEYDLLIDSFDSKESVKSYRLRDYAQLYFETLPKSRWSRAKRAHYYKYIDGFLGSKLLDKIYPKDIKSCIDRQLALGIKERTAKTTLEILRPLYKHAIFNQVAQYNPCDGLSVKVPKSKKMVVGASAKLKEVYSVIMDMFADDPFYRSIFLFALMGRRRGEILSLKWENVDIEHSYIVLEDPKNGEPQKMYISDDIKEALASLPIINEWVYPSRFKDGHIVDIDYTVHKVRERLPWFSMHYMRNILVSAMAERGVDAVYMSGALGHLSANTIDKYLTLNYYRGSEAASKVIEMIVK